MRLQEIPEKFSGTMKLYPGKTSSRKTNSSLSLLELMFHAEIEEFPQGDIIPRVQP